MIKKRILKLDSVLQFGKFKGKTVHQIISGSNKTDDSGINYITWLYTETDCDFDDRVFNYYGKRMEAIRKHKSDLEDELFHNQH